MEPKEIRFKLSMVYQGPDYEDPNPPEEDLTVKKPKGKGAAVPEEPEIRMITPEPVPLDQEGGRVYSLELTKDVKIVLEDKKEEADGLKESSQDIPEDFYEKKKIRFYADQRVKPAPVEAIVQSITSSREALDGPSGSATANAEEVKGSSINKSIREPVYPAPTDDMIVKFSSTAGKAEIGELTFKLDQDFRAGTYVMTCRDVTAGLPPRMRMQHTKILLKIVDLDPPPEEEV